MSSRQLDKPCGIHGTHPSRIEVDRRPIRVKDLVNLPLIGRRIGSNLLTAQRGPGGITSRRVANQAGEITDQEYNPMAEVLKKAHFIDEHRVPEMQIGGRRVETRFDNQWTTGLKPDLQLTLKQNISSTTPDFRQLLVYCAHIADQAGRGDGKINDSETGVTDPLPQTTFPWERPGSAEGLHSPRTGTLL
jgi:hypothetical protein